MLLVKNIKFKLVKRYVICGNVEIINCSGSKGIVLMLFKRLKKIMFSDRLL